MKSKPNLFIAYRKNKFRDFCRKHRWRMTAALTIIVIAAGGYCYYKHPQHSYQKSLNAKNPFVIAGNKEVISEDVLHALQDTAGRKIAVQSICIGYEYWQGKPLTRKTTVEGTMLLTDSSGSSNSGAQVVKKEDPYFKNADIATIEKKWSEMIGADIKLSGIDRSKKFTGYLSAFKKEILGIGKTPQQEIKFKMIETKEAEEKK
jgi:hypothetical protein